MFEASYGQISEAIRALMKRAIKSGDVRKDIDPIDLLWFFFRKGCLGFYKYRRCRTVGSLTVHVRNRSSTWLSAMVIRSC